MVYWGRHHVVGVVRPRIWDKGRILIHFICSYFVLIACLTANFRFGVGFIDGRVHIRMVIVIWDILLGVRQCFAVLLVVMFFGEHGFVLLGFFVGRVGREGIVVVVPEVFSVFVMAGLIGKLIFSTLNLVFLVLLFKFIRRAIGEGVLDAKPVSGALPHEFALLRLRHGKCSLHYNKDISFLLVDLHELFAAFRVITFCFDFIPLPFVSALLSFAVSAFAEEKLLAEVLRSIGPAFGDEAFIGFGSEGNGVIVLEYAFAVFFEGFGRVVGIIVLFFVVILVLLVLLEAVSSLHV